VQGRGVARFIADDIDSSRHPYSVSISDLSFVLRTLCSAGECGRTIYTSSSQAETHPNAVEPDVDYSAEPRSGWYTEAQRGMSQVGAALAENMMQTPAGKFSKQWPEPQRFPQFLDKMGNMMSEDYDWSAEIAKLPMAVLLVFADNDSVSQKHIAEFFALLGGA
jgi:hypothetical protein